MPQEYFLDFHFESAKSSTAAMEDWIRTLISVCVSSNGDEIAKVGLKRACQLVLEQTEHLDDNEKSTSDDNNTPASRTNNLRGIVIHGGILLNDENLCCEALRGVGGTSSIPMMAVVEALKHFGFIKLLFEYVLAVISICGNSLLTIYRLDRTIRRFKHIYQDFRTFIRIYSHYEKYKDSTGLAGLATWMRSRAEKALLGRQIRFKEDGESIAELGIICGEAYIKEA